MTTKIWNDVPTGLDLNGPILSIVTDTFTHAVGDTGTLQTNVCASAPSAGSGTKTIAFTGIATATFPAGSDSSFDGTVEYQWYKLSLNGVETKLGPSTKYSGETSSTLEITYVESPTQNGEQYFVEADYKPRAYSESPNSVGLGRSTPNAINEPLRTTSIALNVLPTLEITAGVSPVIVTTDNEATFTVRANMDSGNNTSSDSKITYQWCIDGDCDISEV